MTDIQKNKKGIPWRSSGLGVCGLTASGAGSIPGQGTKIPQAMQCDMAKKKK